MSSLSLLSSRATKVSFFLFRFFTKVLLLLLCLLPVLVKADGFKFKVKNNSKSPISVFYKVSKKSGDFKLKSFIKLAPGAEKIKEISISKGDTISFYGQNAEDETSAIVRKDFETLNKHKEEVFYIPILIPEKMSANFETLENLGLKLEHNKVLNFLMKMDSSSMTSLSLLENNFQNVYPLGTFIFVDTKTNRLLLPPLEPSFWNNSETYFAIQDSLYALVNSSHQIQGGAQVTLLAKLFDSLKVNNTEELEFKGKLSLIRWKPNANANIYQIINDKSFEAFLQNCYDQIDNPDQQYQHYRLYFLSSYERIDELEIYGKQFYNFGNEADVSLMIGNPNFQLLSTNLGMLYTKNKTLSNYYSVQNSVLRTKAYDFTPLLFNSFKNSVKAKLIDQGYRNQRRLAAAIIGEYKTLVEYNPDPIKLGLVKINDKDTTASLAPVITTIANISPYTYQATDTSRQASAIAKNELLDGFNNKARLFNSHLREISNLIKQLNQTNSDIIKMSEGSDKQYKGYANNSAGLLNEIVVSNKIIRKE